MQNFIYALIQILHNFGAVAIVGIPAVSLLMVRQDEPMRHRLAIFTALAWIIQAMSGALFGGFTFYFEHHLPDIHGIAVDALFVKMFCAICGIAVAVVYIKRASRLSVSWRSIYWRTLLILGIIALSSAAFLRWFS